MRVREITPADAPAWEAFVARCEAATLFHRLPWREVILPTFGHRPVFLLAENESGVRGVLPLVILKTRFFGTLAVSMPFLNYGGVATDDEQAEAALLVEAERIGREMGCKYVEFRHRQLFAAAKDLPTNDFKVTSILDLSPGEEAVWMKSLHQNVRNKIRKADKSDVSIVFGHQGLDDFYRVFTINQRNHGTPVLPKKWFVRTLNAFNREARIYVAYREGRAIGAKLTIDHGGTCYFIWSASLREANRYAPTPAMNWAAIRGAIGRGLRKVDLGRSTKGTGSQQFKKYWGVETETLYWQYHLLQTDETPGLNPTNPKFERAIRTWKKLPVWLTRLLGPPLARDLP